MFGGFDFPRVSPETNRVEQPRQQKRPNPDSGFFSFFSRVGFSSHWRAGVACVCARDAKQGDGKRNVMLCPEAKSERV